MGERRKKRTLRAEDELWTRVLRLSESLGVSASDIVREFLIDGLERREHWLTAVTHHATRRSTGPVFASQKSKQRGPYQGCLLRAFDLQDEGTTPRRAYDQLREEGDTYLPGLEGVSP